MGAAQRASRGALSAAAPLGDLALEVRDRGVDAVDREDLVPRRRVEAEELVALLLDPEDAVDRLEDEPVILERLTLQVSDDAAVRHEDVVRSQLDPAGALELVEARQLNEPLLIASHPDGVSQPAADRGRRSDRVAVQPQVSADLLEAPPERLQPHRLRIALRPSAVGAARGQRHQDVVGHGTSLFTPLQWCDIVTTRNRKDWSTRVSARDITRTIKSATGITVHTGTTWSNPAKTRISYFTVVVSEPSREAFLRIRTLLGSEFNVTPQLRGSDPYEQLRVERVMKKGTRVELISTSDPLTQLKPGDRGTVSQVDSLGTVHTRWDSGSSLGMVPGEDVIREVQE